MGQTPRDSTADRGTKVHHAASRLLHTTFTTALGIRCTTLSTTAQPISNSQSSLLFVPHDSAINNCQIWQDVFYPPSRVTTQYLARNGKLPSSLSKYEAVTPIAIDDGASILIGVHSIQYTQQTSKSDSQQINPKYDGISLHHGFGASSLSWLPVVPSLVDCLGSSKAPGVAHDIPGFGNGSTLYLPT